jgi:phospholipid/cholesterol/gamma-HCH transport system substrate-binding protein
VGRNSLLGLCVTGAALVVLIWGFLGKPNPFAHERSVWAVFRNAASFARFDREVRVGGADIGTVGQVRRDGDHALVQLKLPASIGTIHADAIAAIRPHTLFDGSSFVEFSPGSPGAQPLGDRVIPLSQTQDYVSVDKALRFATAPTRDALRSLARNLSASLGPAETSRLRTSFRGAPQLYGRLRPAALAAGGPTQTELAGSIRGFASTAGALARAQTSYGPLLRAVSATFAAVRTQSDAPLDRTLTELPRALAAVDTGGQALRSTIAHLEPLATALTPGVRELAPTLAQLRPLLRGARPVLSEARPFIGVLRATLAAAQQGARPGTALIDALRSLVDDVGHNLLPFLSSASTPGPPIYRELLAFASSAAGTLSPVQTPQQSGKNGPGHLWHVYARGMVGISGLPPCSAYGTPRLEAVLQSLALCVP